MKTKTTCAILAIVFCISFLSLSVQAANKPSEVYTDASNIGGSNFFKLRELMEVLDVFVGYDSVERAATLDTSKGYGVG